MGRRERVGAVFDGVEATAVEAILDLPDAVGVVGAEHGRPSALKHTAKALGRDDAFKEERGQDGSNEALENLEDQGKELVKTADGGGGGMAAISGGVEKTRVSIGVEEAGDGEEDG